MRKIKENKIKREMILVWTRDFTLAWAEWWLKYMNPRLEEFFGAGIPNQLCYFNGQLLETYRPLDEINNWLEAIMGLDLDGDFLNKENIRRYLEIIKEMRLIIKLANKEKNFSDQSAFTKLRVLSEEMYPWFTVCFLLPQKQGAVKLKKKYPAQAQGILDRLIDMRRQSEGVIEELVEYWRAVASGLLASRGLSVSYDSFVSLGEMEEMFDNKNYAPDKKELEARASGYIFFKNSVQTNISRQDFFNQQGFFYKPEFGDVMTAGLKGTVASLGPASIKGRVQIILKNDQVGNFKAGNILVTVMTSPFFVPAMKKAAAIVTDEGGLTCHAAIVSRELEIPCIIGTKFASKVLHDGDLVEVDANRGIVKKIKK